MIDSPSWSEQRTILYEIQEGRCGACGLPLLGEFRLDHDHETGLTRGLLCPSCNTREGAGWRDRGIAEYLEHPPAEKLGWLWRDSFNRPFRSSIDAERELDERALARADLTQLIIEGDVLGLGTFMRESQAP
jgi:hypothetical protein